jgi:hypothetical protein
VPFVGAWKGTYDLDADLCSALLLYGNKAHIPMLEALRRGFAAPLGIVPRADKLQMTGQGYCKPRAIQGETTALLSFFF